MTKLSGALPKGIDGNGLDRIGGDLAADPSTKHLILAVVDCSKITTNTDTGEVEPTARILQIEAVRAADGDAALRMLERAYEDRTGQAKLPLELENSLRELGASIKSVTFTRASAGKVDDGGDDEADE